MRFTLVVADDEKNIREGLAEALALDGYRALMASDGEEAMRLVDSGDVDLVITDLRMPEMDGFDLIRGVRALPEPPHVVMITAFGSIKFVVHVLLGVAVNILRMDAWQWWRRRR